MDGSIDALLGPNPLFALAVAAVLLIVMTLACRFVWTMLTSMRDRVRAFVGLDEPRDLFRALPPQYVAPRHFQPIIRGEEAGPSPAPCWICGRPKNVGVHDHG